MVSMLRLAIKAILGKLVNALSLSGLCENVPVV